MDLVPFVITHRHNLPLLHLDGALGAQVKVMLVEDPRTRPFGLLMNHTNQLAFGGDNMGMPLWVLLDCGILPCAVVGLALPREQASDALLSQLGVQGEPPALIPITEYCACPTLEPRCVSGFSLQSQVPGRGLGARTKALALWAYGSRAQIGVTQYDNPAIRVHATLGPMQLLAHRPSLHTHPERSFVYRLELPEREILRQMATGELARAEQPLPEGEPWTFHHHDERDHARLRAALDAGRRIFIKPPGWSTGADGPRLDLIEAP